MRLWNWVQLNSVTLAVAGVIGLIGFGIWAVFFWSRPIDVIVTGHNWVHEQQVEDFQPRQQSLWCDAMPADAYNITRYREARGSHQQYTGQTCTTDSDGDQTCRANYITVTDYDDKCYYTVDRWAYERSVYANGDRLTEAVYWPNPDLSPCVNVIFGCERAGQQIPSYTVHFRDGETSYQCDFDFSRWLSMRMETWWSGEVGNITGWLKCNSLSQR